MEPEKVTAEMLRLNCDWVDTKFNVPSASHMGGVWERQIRTVRSVLSAILEKNGTQLNDEALRTFMCEAEAVVNSRPLTTDNINSTDSLEALTPNHLLTLKTKVILPPPGVFNAADQYSRKQWRRVQHLTNEFWTRWRKEFLHSLQERQKWSRKRRNFQTGDVVILKEEDSPRNRSSRVSPRHTRTKMAWSVRMSKMDFPEIPETSVSSLTLFLLEKEKDKEVWISFMYPPGLRFGDLQGCLAVGQWVAVAYDEGYYIGEIKAINIRFLEPEDEIRVKWRKMQPVKRDI
ncbi:hypothetical protein QZH41_013726 [Actinostola sp. cb2023]|nr:hypothetical protein QZH41_013726 [Actinostola sp. cb2023]